MATWWNWSVTGVFFLTLLFQGSTTFTELISNRKVRLTLSSAGSQTLLPNPISILAIPSIKRPRLVSFPGFQPTPPQLPPSPPPTMSAAPPPPLSRNVVLQGHIKCSIVIAINLLSLIVRILGVANRVSGPNKGTEPAGEMASSWEVREGCIIDIHKSQ